jgi:hypothetical protein
MTIFRWIIGVLAALFATGALLSFALFVAFDGELWQQRARTMRRGLYMALLLWFNVEVWGRVLWALIH